MRRQAVNHLARSIIALLVVGSVCLIVGAATGAVWLLVAGAVAYLAMMGLAFWGVEP